MPRVSRRRLIAAPSDRVWDLISDPHSLPRWWPRTIRVEDVHEIDGETQWTSVLQTERGTGVRADFRCTEASAGERYAWEQQIEGTPFERVLRAARLEIGMRTDGGATEVTLTSDEALRGISRLGSTMMKGAARGRLDEALAGLERVLVG